MIRRWGPWLALGLVVVVALAVVLWPSGSQSLAERAHDLETEIKCPECSGLSVADSQAPTSRAMRADIKRRINDGQSDAEIRQAYIDTYGESILLSPQDSGVSLLVWILPIVVVALGATGIVFALRRNRDQPHLHATEADERLVRREQGDG
jgi:cytochrome c-type biogenesis protein CcmH